MATIRNARHFILSLSVAAALTGGLLLSGAGSATAAGLFEAASSVDMRAAPTTRSTAGTLRSRLVRLNVAELARIVPAGVDNAADRLQRAQGLNGAVTIDLFPGVSVTAQRTDIETPDGGGYVWTGKANNSRPAWVTLVINGGEVLGHIQTGGKLYSIEPISGVLHRVIEVDQNKIRDDLHIPPPPNSMQKKSETDKPLSEAAAPKAASTTINIMVAHTKNARLEVGTATQMQSRINMAIALNNTAFTNSGVLIKYVRVGGANEIDYKDTTLYGGNTSNNYTGALCDLTGFSNCFGTGNNQTAKFAALRTKRTATTVRADLVVLMRKAGVACGVAWVPNVSGTVSTANRDLGYSVVTSSPSYGCIEGNTLAHETGHNQGMNHDRVQYKLDYGAATPPASQYNFGHVNKTKRFFTIMSYRSSCGNACTRIPYFSTPLKKYLNTPVGVAQGVGGNYGAADAVKRLNANRSIIGAYQ